MTLDEELLKKAVAAAKQLDDAERTAAEARTGYRMTIRRLHLGGASLREIAEALSLSHQRVQQIVSAAGGSWWQKIWRTRVAKANARCTFCDRPRDTVGRLVSGPEVLICDSCIAHGERVLVGESSKRLALAKATSAARCSFCGSRRSSGRQITLGQAANICSECLAVSRQILNDTRT